MNTVEHLTFLEKYDTQNALEGQIELNSVVLHTAAFDSVSISIWLEEDSLLSSFYQQPQCRFQPWSRSISGAFRMLAELSYGDHLLIRTEINQEYTESLYMMHAGAHIQRDGFSLRYCNSRSNSCCGKRVRARIELTLRARTYLESNADQLFPGPGSELTILPSASELLSVRNALKIASGVQR